eukprot:COSAG02_NODE_8189_length_2668_cov_496.662125_3_plen_227_part_00
MVGAGMASVMPDAVPLPPRVLPYVHVLPWTTCVSGDYRVRTFETIGTDDRADIVQPKACRVDVVVVTSLQDNRRRAIRGNPRRGNGELARKVEWVACYHSIQIDAYVPPHPGEPVGDVHGEAAASCEAGCALAVRTVRQALACAQRRSSASQGRVVEWPVKRRALNAAVLGEAARRRAVVAEHVMNGIAFGVVLRHSLLGSATHPTEEQHDQRAVWSAGTDAVARF